MTPHRPQEIFGFSKPIIFIDYEQTNVDKFGRGGHFMDIFSNPIERVEIAKPTFAIFDIGFDHISAVPHAPVSIVAFHHF